MKYTNQEFRKKLAQMILDGEADEQTDSKGQIIIYTGFFEHSSHEPFVHDVPDPEWDNEHKYVTCSMCNKSCIDKDAHFHNGLYIGNECCWDERLKSTE